MDVRRVGWKPTLTAVGIKQERVATVVDEIAETSGLKVDSKAETDFRSSILKCIDSGLDVLGDVSKQVVYAYLAQNRLSREMIPDEPWKFTETLRKLLGRGEEVLERTIVMELKRTFEITSSGGMLVEILAAVRLRKGSENRREIHGRTRKSHDSVNVSQV